MASRRFLRSKYAVELVEIFDFPSKFVPLVIISRASCPFFMVGLTSSRKTSFAASKNIGYATTSML